MQTPHVSRFITPAINRALVTATTSLQLRVMVHDVKFRANLVQS